MLPVRLSTRLLVACKSLESKKKKSTTVAGQEVGHLRAKEPWARMYDPLRLLVCFTP